MLIRNLSNRTLNLKDSTGQIYTTTPYGNLTVSDSLWNDNEFRRNLRLRIREVEVESVTAGASSPTDAPYITTAAVAGLSAEKVLGTEIIMKGTLGTRPAAGINGRLYYVTDSGQQRLTRDTGSAWEDLKHGDSHAPGGLDPITAALDTNARVAVRRNSGSTISTRRALNFIEGSGVTISISDDAANEEADITIGGGATTGMISMWGATTAPTGWLMCNGAAVSRTTYSALFAIISTGWGAGDGSTTFNLPDLQGRVPVGIGTHSEVNALGKNDGIATVADRRVRHKHTASSSVTDSGHSHSVNDPGHSHSITLRDGGNQTSTVGASNTTGSATGTTQSATTGITINSNTTGISVTTTVGQQANSPTDGAAFIAIPFIIKT